MLNVCNFIGRLGQSPESRYTQSGEAVTSFSIACSEKYKDRDGNYQEKTAWIPIQVWGKRAETCAKYLDKGSLVHVTGKFSTRKWQDKQGNDRYTTEIIAQNVVFLDSKKDSAQQGEQSTAQGNYNQQFEEDYNSGMPF